MNYYLYLINGEKNHTETSHANKNRSENYTCMWIIAKENSEMKNEINCNFLVIIALVSKRVMDILTLQIRREL